MNRYTGELREVFERFREVGAREVWGAVQRHDSAYAFNREAWKRVGESGLFRLHVPVELGGEGKGLREWAAAIEGFAVGSGDLGFSVSVVAHAGCLITALTSFCSRAQQLDLLPKLLSGEWVGAVANAEPGVGSDVMGIRSQARRCDDGFVVKARKRNITNLGPADLIATSARLEGEEARKAINIFLVEGSNARVRQRSLRDLMGLRTSPTGDLLAWRAHLPERSLVGKPGDGVGFFRMIFSLERLFIGYLYLAAIQRCLERAVYHAEHRIAFGDKIGKNQYVQEKIVRMRIAQELLSAQLDRTMNQHLEGEDVFGALSVIKAFGVDAARRSAEDLVGLLGSRGMRQGERAEKDFRDLMGLSILGGTQELQKMVIYKETVKALESVAPPPVKTANPLSIDVRSAKEIDRSLEASLVNLVGRCFPDQSWARDRYYYDSPPDYVIVARCNGQIIGFRALFRRTVQLGDQNLRLAGTGVAVDPDFQHLGVGKRLTYETLNLCRSLADDIVMAFLLSRNAEQLLKGFGFCRLEAQVSYTDRSSHDRVVEQMPCFAYELNESGVLLSKIEAKGEIYLGVGTW